MEDVNELPAEDGDDVLEVLFELESVGVELGLGRGLIDDQSEPLTGAEEQHTLKNLNQ